MQPGPAHGKVTGEVSPAWAERRLAFPKPDSLFTCLRMLRPWRLGCRATKWVMEKPWLLRPRGSFITLRMAPDAKLEALDLSRIIPANGQIGDWSPTWEAFVSTSLLRGQRVSRHAAGS